MSTCLGLFYAERLENRVHSTFIFESFCVLRGLFLAYNPVEDEIFLNRSIKLKNYNLVDTIAQ